MSAEEVKIRAEPPRDEIATVIREGVDPTFYLSQLPETARGADPIAHYLNEGWKQGLDPSPHFSTSYYLSRSPDVRTSGVNPFYHYLRWGKLEGRRAKAREAVGEEEAPETQSEVETAIRSEFDEQFYCEQHPEIRANNIDPVKHYIHFGWQQGFDPTPWFSTSFYVRRSPDVSSRALNPFYHYLKWGRPEGRLAAPNAASLPDPRIGPPSQIEIVVRENIDEEFYCREHPEIRENNVDPVKHYLSFGWRSGYDPCPDFSTAFYVERSPDVAEKDLNPYYHFLMWGKLEGRLPKAIDPALEASTPELPNEIEVVVKREFDAEFYCEQHPSIRENHVDPVKHYLHFGWRQSFDPAPWFSTSFYLARSPDVRAREINPFFHYLRWGRLEGRLPAPPDSFPPDLKAERPTEFETVVRNNFDEEFYFAQHPELRENHADPVKHYLNVGWRKGYDPTPWFSTDYYIHHNPQVGAADLNPFYHFLQTGKAEGALPQRMVGNSLRHPRPLRESSISVLFVLPSGNIAGGVNSVVQETSGLAKLGINTRIVVDKRNYAQFLANYPELETLNVKSTSYANSQELAEEMAEFAITVATTNASVSDVSAAHEQMKGKSRARSRIAYYVQDYEPLFYHRASDMWTAACRSYTLIPEAVLFAKTKWLQDIVYANHGVRVAKVSPSIDHDTFYPGLNRREAQLSVTAMLRPQTPRRAPRRTLRIMENLAAAFGDTVSLRVFGSDPSTLLAEGIELSPKIENYGVLLRHETAELLRSSDLFLDLSDYQAFGRTGLEGMACGCVPVVPLLGGALEYAANGRNAFVVDTRCDDAILDAVHDFRGMSSDSREQMQLNALEAAAKFTILRAALSELRVFQAMGPSIDDTGSHAG